MPWGFRVRTVPPEKALNDESIYCHNCRRWVEPLPIGVRGPRVKCGHCKKQLWEALVLEARARRKEKK